MPASLTRTLSYRIEPNCLSNCSYQRQPKCPCGTTNPTTTTERNALLQLYNATGGARWSAPWTVTSDSDPCIDIWAGVICHDSTPNAQVMYVYVEMRIVARSFWSSRRLQTCQWSLRVRLGVNILGYHYRGFPDVFCALVSSQVALSSNNLQGTIPSGLTGLSAIVALDLSNNLLSGTIPSSLGTFPSLTYVQVERCNLNANAGIRVEHELPIVISESARLLRCRGCNLKTRTRR